MCTVSVYNQFVESHERFLINAYQCHQKRKASVQSLDAGRRTNLKAHPVGGNYQKSKRGTENNMSNVQNLKLL